MITRGGRRPLNENEHRLLAASNQYSSASSDDFLTKGGAMVGLASVFLLTRRGASHMLDFSTVRQCWWRTYAYYMVGVSSYSLYKVTAEGLKMPNRAYNLNKRVN